MNSTGDSLRKNAPLKNAINTLSKHALIIRDLEPVWYVCLKTKNCCLKTFVKIRVGEKVY